MTFRVIGRFAADRLVGLTDGLLPDLPVPPAGRTLDLPGRGATHVVDLPGPTPDAPVVLLMHGIATTGTLTWFSVLADLAADYRVVTFDQRWHGRGIRSDHFLLDDCADDAVAVLDALGIGRAVVVGYSMGGASAQVLWRRHPDRVAGLLLCSTAARWQGHVGERLFFGTLRIANSGRTAMAADKVRAHGDTVPLVPGEAANLREWCLAELRCTSLWVLPAVMAELGRFDSTSWIGGVEVPAGVVVTARDRAIPITRQRALAALLPAAAVREAPGGHTSLAFDLDRWKPVFLEAVADVVERSLAAAA